MPLHHNGINVPVFSLKCKTSGGIGEFLDLIPLIDWVKSMGMDIIQILPINDSGLDTSPYNLQSAFALNPLFIKWPSVHSDDLNLLHLVDYDRVRDLKEKAVQNMKWPAEEMKTFARTFSWVEEYARHKEGDKSIFEQYIAYLQMKHVKAYAEQQGVQIFGDIPILIAPDSIDVKTHPELFLKDLSAGAPPDMYSQEGQNWGFPLYDWHALKKQNYRWWKDRLAYASNFYHLYRIDHIVGFYRMWACQPNGKGNVGKFIPEDAGEWIPQGEEILKIMLEATSMKPIGEDLGTVPDEVRASLARLGIPGTKVLRWERKWHERGHPFIPLREYPSLSLTTLSTHDSTSLNAWWKTHPEDSKAFADSLNWNWSPDLSPEQHAEILKLSHSTPSIYHVNLITEYLSDDTRINEPGVISDKNWSWRMPSSMEQISQDSSLKKLIGYCINP